MAAPQTRPLTTHLLPRTLRHAGPHERDHAPSALYFIPGIVAFGPVLYCCVIYLRGHALTAIYIACALASFPRLELISTIVVTGTSATVTTPPMATSLVREFLLIPDCPA